MVAGEWRFSQERARCCRGGSGTLPGSVKHDDQCKFSDELSGKTISVVFADDHALVAGWDDYHLTWSQP